jgi:hypothetical protein
MSLTVFIRFYFVQNFLALGGMQSRESGKTVWKTLRTLDCGGKQRDEMPAESG